MKILGICGRKRHGKDTVGHFLQSQGRYTPIAFADPIKRIAMDIYGLSYDQCYGSDEFKEAVDSRWGVTPRHIMQQIGTEVARAIHPETWVRYCLSTIDKASGGEQPLIHWAPARGFVAARTDLLIPEIDIRGPYTVLTRWVITDVRFPNEAEHIRAAGGKIIKVVRPSLEGKQGDTHSSETSIDEIEPDHLILNDGTLADLRAKVLGVPHE